MSKKPNRFCAWVNGVEYEPPEGDDVKSPTTIAVEREMEKMEAGKEPHHEDNLPERLEKWSGSSQVKNFNKFYIVMAIVLAVVIIGSLLVTVAYLPRLGDPANPANNEVPAKYITDGIEDTGAMNIVAGMILDYRAFDTFGESTLLFVAAGAVIVLLRNDRKKRGRTWDDAMFEPKEDSILANVSRFIVPVCLIFGLYVVLNGHLSPGGGFSGGAIMGGGLILYACAYGRGWAKAVVTYRRFCWIMVACLGGYAASKSYSFFTGANHIESAISKGVPGDLISSGLILVLNIFVGIVVALTMFGFYSLVDREEI